MILIKRVIIVLVNLKVSIKITSKQLNFVVV